MNTEKNKTYRNFKEIVEMAKSGNWYGVFLAFMPLVWSWAERLCGDGVEFADVSQEGFVALLEVLQMFRFGKGVDLRWIVYVIERRVPQRMRRYARKWRWKFDVVPFDLLEETTPDYDAEYRFLEREIEETLVRILSEEEREIVWALYDGLSQRKIAEERGEARQTTNNDVKEIRRKVLLAITGGTAGTEKRKETRGRKRGGPEDGSR